MFYKLFNYKDIVFKVGTTLWVLCKYFFDYLLNKIN